MEDSNFIDELRSGHQAAYSKLIDVYKDKIFYTCLSFVPNKEDAEDIAQEVFIEIFKSIKKFKENSALSTWIYRIATNKCLEFIRKKNTKKRFAFLQVINGNDISLTNSNYFTEVNHPGIILENKEKTKLLFYAINQLPESQRLVFTLHKLEGKSYQEINDLTRKSISSIESLMFRAKKKLQELLVNYYKNEI
ncbi:RNA polymerase sigma factor [Cellulophaga sp. L1A9]|uniref:RNA polymerase sigma factor n=1 Tax=Cellulophaga sp. L1A9 TaxID=2686362 RepID=UPI00131DCE46|nr:RNA polymerase sigma factor [Cellulophaga sp. L1A9]